MSDYLWKRNHSMRRCLWLYLDSLGEINQCSLIATWHRAGIAHQRMYVCNHHKQQDDRQQLDQDLRIGPTFDPRPEGEESGVPA